MDDLIAFIAARLDDDERYANVILAVGERVKASPTPAMTEFAKGAIDAFLDDPEAVAEVMRWKSQPPNDLKHVLREVAAKRAILAEHKHAKAQVTDPGEPDFGCLVCHYDRDYGTIGDGWCATVRHLASVWSDHPDCRREWAP